MILPFTEAFSVGSYTTWRNLEDGDKKGGLSFTI
jgi:hypothetical protein